MPLSEASWRLGPSRGPQLRRAGGLSRATRAGNRRQSPWVPGSLDLGPAGMSRERGRAPHSLSFSHSSHVSRVTNSSFLHHPGTGVASRRKTSRRKSPDRVRWCLTAGGRPRDPVGVLGRNSVLRFRGQTLGYRNVNEPLKPVLSLASVASRASVVWRARHADCAPRSPPQVRLGAPALPTSGSGAGLSPAAQVGTGPPAPRPRLACRGCCRAPGRAFPAAAAARPGAHGPAVGPAGKGGLCGSKLLSRT